MDPVVTDQLLRVMVEDFANEGRTLVLSSHHLSEVERIAEWVGIIDQGKLLLEARLDDMRTNFRRVRVVGEALALAEWPDIVSANTGEGTTSMSSAPMPMRLRLTSEARARPCSTLRR